MYTLIVIIVASKYIKQKLNIIEANIIIVAMNVNLNFNMHKNLNIENVKFVVNYMKQKRIPHNVFAPQNVKESGNLHKQEF